MRRKTYKMRRHKRYKYMKGGEDGDEMDETDVCPICLDPFDEDNHITECNHRFHGRCINQSTRNNCPMCRGNINLPNRTGPLVQPHQVPPPYQVPPHPALPLRPISISYIYRMMLENQSNREKRHALRRNNRELINVLRQLSPIPADGAQRVERRAIINPGAIGWRQYYTPHEINEYTTKVVPYLNENYGEQNMSPYELVQSYQRDHDDNIIYGNQSDSDDDSTSGGGRRTRRRTRTRKSKRRRTTKRRGSFRRRRMSRRRVR